MKRFLPILLFLLPLLFSGCSFHSLVDFIIENHSSQNITISYTTRFDKIQHINTISPQTKLIFLSLETGEREVDLSNFKTVPLDSFLIESKSGLPYNKDETDLEPWTKLEDDDYGYFRLTVRDGDF